jgi:hypothetical protein
MYPNPLSSMALAASLVLAVSASHAAEFGGIEFPAGLPSFADKVVSFNPTLIGGNPIPQVLNPLTTLGAPNYPNGPSFVSLGAGGQIVLEFEDNFLTGSDSAAPDLHIFEIGDGVEATFVAISKNGQDWEEIGKVFGSTSSIDIDAFNFGSQDRFRFVRLIDDPLDQPIAGITEGADIDAVGAISTIRRNHVPDHGSSALMVGIALAGLLGARRRWTRQSNR